MKGKAWLFWIKVLGLYKVLGGRREIREHDMIKE